MVKLSLTNVTLKPTSRVLIRVDFNVPFEKNTTTISNTQRIDAALPTIEHCLNAKVASIVLMSHLGRPGGRVSETESMLPVFNYLQTTLPNVPIIFLKNLTDATTALASPPSTTTLYLLENLRFWPEEEGKGKNADGSTFKPTADAITTFRATLSSLGDVYINDAFGTAHRAHSSMVGIDLPIRAAGLLLNKELVYFAKALDTPAHPFVSVLGGAKVQDKIQLILNLLDIVDDMVIGGGMAFTFKKVLNDMAIGASLYDTEGAALVQAIMDKATLKGVTIHLPTDFIAASAFASDAECKTVAVSEGIPDTWMGLDIGPDSTMAFASVVAAGKTIVWNGPMGVFEFDAFSHGTQGVMAAVVRATSTGATTIIGGGDTATCCVKYHTSDKVSHVSTGGGASLELLEGKELPGVAALSEA